MSSIAPHESASVSTGTKRIKREEAQELDSSSQKKTKKSVDVRRTLPFYTPTNFHSYARAHGFKFEPQDDDLKAVFFAPVALLAGEMGAYASTRIESGVRLGRYHGTPRRFDKETLDQTQNQRDYFFVTASDLFLDGIDGKKKRNFTAMVNGTSEHLANIEAVDEGDRIDFYTSKTIYPGDQLLICYGDDYVLDETFLLNPKDNWRTSSRLLEKFNHYYQFAGKFPHLLTSFLDMPPREYALVGPREGLQRNRETVDLPLVLFNRNERTPISLLDSENLSPLMYYCWLGESDKVVEYLENGADPNRQSAKKGVTALHLVLSSPGLEAGTRLEIIQHLLASGALFKIGSAKGHCPFSFLVNNDESFLSFEDKLEIICGLIEKNIICDEQSSRLNKLYSLILTSFELNLEQKKSLIACLKHSATPDFVNENEESLFLKMIAFGNLPELITVKPFIGKHEVDELEEGGCYHGEFCLALEELCASENIAEDDKKNIIRWLGSFLETHDASEQLMAILTNLWFCNFEESETESVSAVEDESHLSPQRVRAERNDDTVIAARALIEVRQQSERGVSSRSQTQNVKSMGGPR